MPFPQIIHCLICEIVRPEVGGKLSILGFFGIAPNVEIQVQNLDVPLSVVSFVFVGSAYRPSPSDPAFQISIQLTNSQGTVITETPSIPLEIPKAPSSRALIAGGLANVRFPAVGTYHIAFRVNGQTQYDTTFEVKSPSGVSSR